MSIRLYAKMNRNFKGGIDNVMIEYNDTVDSRGLQRCVDGHHCSLVHASAHDKPIREKGRFGYVGAPVTDIDWLYGCAVLFVPVGDVRIGYIKSAVGRGQSTDAAPVKTCVLQLLRRGVLPVYRTMEGAALVDDHVGVQKNRRLVRSVGRPGGCCRHQFGGCSYARLGSKQGRSIWPP